MSIFFTHILNFMIFAGVRNLCCMCCPLCSARCLFATIYLELISLMPVLITKTIGLLAWCSGDVTFYV